MDDVFLPPSLAAVLRGGLATTEAEAAARSPSGASGASSSSLNELRWEEPFSPSPPELNIERPDAYLPPKDVDRLVSLLAEGAASGGPHAAAARLLLRPGGAVAGALNRAIATSGGLGLDRAVDFNYLTRHPGPSTGLGGVGTDEAAVGGGGEG